MEIRKGDVVSVEVVVDFISAGTVYCSSLGHGTGVSFPLDYDKVKLIRRRFEVGEDVIFKDPSARTKHHASIIALHEDWAWVKLPSGNAVTARVRDLEIIEAIVDTPPAPIPGGNGTWVPAPADPLDPGPQLGDEMLQPMIDKTVELAKDHGIDLDDAVAKDPGEF